MTRKKKRDIAILYEFKAGYDTIFLAAKYRLRRLDIEEIIRQAMKEQEDV